MIYFVMALLFLALAALDALGVSLINWQLVSGYAGLRWLRIHLITLGALTEVLFGMLPLLLSSRYRRPRPRTRWDIWLTLNAGIMLLLVGIPLVNALLITSGGTLVFIATLLLMHQLTQIRPAANAPVAVHNEQAGSGRLYYLTGLSFLLLGITIGTGLWQSWLGVMQLAAPLEVHIHTNSWGFLSLVFAGLIFDYYPQFTGRAIAWPSSVRPIFWLMTLGALGLVLGPWFKLDIFLIPGLIMHLTATVWLLANMIRPLVGDRQAWTPGVLHLITAYFWLLLPILVAPLILLGVPGVPGLTIEQNAPQALIYGWAMQMAFALLPFLVRRAMQPQLPATLGGNWLSLATAHAGGVLLWLGIFIEQGRGLLHGFAYALWAIALIPIVIEIGRILFLALDAADSDLATLPAD